MHQPSSHHPQGLVQSIATTHWRAELLPKSAYEASYVASAPVIGFAFEAQSGIHAFASDRRAPFRAKPNHLSFLPRGCDVYSQSPQGGEYLKITLLCGNGRLAGSQCRFSNVVDIAAMRAAQALRRHFLAGPAPEPLECERLVHALVEQVAGVLDGHQRAYRAAAWMTPRRQALILELIEQRLAESLTVGELAASLGLSPAFFSRAFKGAFGQAPHDYIIDRRLARARMLLSAGKANLAGIAQSCGFSSHAHMSAVFQARFGVAPSSLQMPQDGEKRATS